MDLEKQDTRVYDFGSLRAPEELDVDDRGEEVERAELLPVKKDPNSSFRTGIFWMVINTLATIAIVSDDPRFNGDVGDTDDNTRSLPTKPSLTLPRSSSSS